MKTLVITFSILGLLLAIPAITPKVQAQEVDQVITAADLGVSEPSTGFVGWLKNLGFNIQYGLTFNPIKKANMKLDAANQRLLEAQAFLLENPDKTQAQIQYQQALAKYENAMQKVESMTEKFKDKSATNPKIDQFMNRFTDNVLKHQAIIDRMKNNVSGDKLAILQKIEDNTIKNFGEILKNIETPERFPERIANIIENIGGEDASRYLKGVELLTWLNENTQGDIKKYIQNGLDLSLRRLDGIWENWDPEARTERVKIYLNGASDPTMKDKVLDLLENNVNVDSNLQAIIQEKKDDLTQTRLERAQENVKSDIQNEATGDDSINQVQEDKDIRDAIRNRQNNSNENPESAD